MTEEEMQAVVEPLLRDILANWKDGAECMLLVGFDGEPEKDFVFGSLTLDDAIGIMRRAKDRTPL